MRQVLLMRVMVVEEAVPEVFDKDAGTGVAEELGEAALVDAAARDAGALGGELLASIRMMQSPAEKFAVLADHAFAVGFAGAV